MLRFNLYLLSLIIFIVATVASCGQTGDLYLPEENSEEETKDKPKS